jgi:hypothetical protein
MDRCGTHRPTVWRPGAPAPARLRANRRTRRRRCRRSPASGRGSAGRGARFDRFVLAGGGRGALDLPALEFPEIQQAQLFLLGALQRFKRCARGFPARVDLRDLGPQFAPMRQTCRACRAAIERRLFSQISKNWAAEPLTDYGKILGLIRKTTTTTGLRVRAYLDTKDYPSKSNRLPKGYENSESPGTRPSQSGTTP